MFSSEEQNLSRNEFIRDEQPLIFEWLRNVVYWTGWFVGKRVKEGFHLEKYNFKAGWILTHGIVDIQITSDELLTLSTLSPPGYSKPVTEYRVFRRNYKREYGTDFVIDWAIQIEQIASTFIPNLQWRNLLRICANPHCDSSNRNIPTACRIIRGKHLCKRCVDLFSLIQQEPQTRSKETVEDPERAKMKPSLRYSILERDNFTCRACGRTVKEGVKLHVDHIYPISKGGKTEPDNLQVLCQECNLGKSDRVS